MSAYVNELKSKSLTSSSPSSEKDDHFIYVGDGRNDFCPGLKCLNAKDYFFVRNGHSFAKLMAKNENELAEQIQAQIKYWSSASDIISYF